MGQLCLQAPSALLRPSALGLLTLTASLGRREAARPAGSPDLGAVRQGWFQGPCAVLQLGPTTWGGGNLVMRGPWGKGVRRLLGWRELSLGVFAVAPCWELADVPEVWKRLSQVKKTQTGALGIRESFPKGLSPAVLSVQGRSSRCCCTTRAGAAG